MIILNGLNGFSSDTICSQSVQDYNLPLALANITQPPSVRPRSSSTPNHTSINPMYCLFLCFPIVIYILVQYILLNKYVSTEI